MFTLTDLLTDLQDQHLAATADAIARAFAEALAR